MVTRIEDLVRARKRLAAGVGVTTLEQRVLPFVPIDVQIPARVGTAAPPSYRSAIAEPACLGSPLTEKPIGAGQPIDMYTLREWHTDRAALVSIDGLFSFARKPLKRWSAKLANLTLVEFFFSSPGTAASIYSPTAGAVQICEAAWSTREWHDRISATAGSLKLEFTLRRMKSISLQQDAYAFQWLFSSDSDPSTSGTPPACINRRSTENGLSNRLTYSNGQIKQFSLLSSGSQLAVIGQATPGGFLGALEVPPADRPTPIDLRNASGVACSDLSDALHFGQPWHGWMTSAGIETPAGTVKPSGYNTPTSATAHYVAIDGLPDPPTDTPTGFAAAGKQWFKDAILYGDNKRYSPLSTFEVGPTRWLHYANGVVHVLRATQITAATATSVTVQIFNDGVLTINGVVGSSVQIGSFTLTSPDSSTLPAGWTPSAGSNKYPIWYLDPSAFPSPTRFYAVSGFTGGASWGWNPVLPINQSPSGHKVALCHYQVLTPNGVSFSYPKIVSVWELTVDDALACSISQKWQIDKSYTSLGGYSNIYWEVYYHDYVRQDIGDMYFPAGGFTAPAYRVRWNEYVRGPYVISTPAQSEEEVLMAGYDQSETLVLVKATTSFVEMAGAWATYVDSWNQIVRSFSTDYYCDVDGYRHPDLTGQVFNHQYNSVDLHCNRMAISSASLTTTISAPEPTLAYSGPATYSFGGFVQQYIGISNIKQHSGSVSRIDPLVSGTADTSKSIFYNLHDNINAQSVGWSAGHDGNAGWNPRTRDFVWRLSGGVIACL